MTGTSRFRSACVLLVASTAILAGCTSRSSTAVSRAPSATTPPAVASTVTTSTTHSLASGVAGSSVVLRRIPTTPVPPPGGAGNVNQTATAAPAARTAPPVAAGATAAFGGGVTGSIIKVSGITGKAQGPGEVGGPAVALEIGFTNSTNKAVSLDAVVVNVDDASKFPASPLSGPPASNFRGELAAGTSATGTYVFALRVQHKNPLRITLSYTADAPVAVFTASVK